MMPTLQLIEDRLPPGAARAAPLAPAHRIFYVAEGEAAVGGAPVRAGEARYAAGEVALAAGAAGAAVWRWELCGEAAAHAKLAAALEPHGIVRGHWLMRCDGVWFPPGGRAYLHTHRGPGIRCLLHGAIRIDAAGASTWYAPGEAWFEPGPEPVFAQADPGQPTRFIRVMLLPPSLAGQPSIAYLRAEDQDKPKAQRYRVYVDQAIDL